MTAPKTALPSEASAKAGAPFQAELPAPVFAAALARLASLAPDRATIPIVQHALLRWTGKTALTLAATNLDQALAVTVKATAVAGAKNGGEGAITASAARLAAIGQLLDPGQPVKLKQTETGLTISQGRSTWRLPTLPAEDFPAGLVEPLEGATLWTVPAEALVAHLKEIEGAAAAEDDIRPYLAGFFFDLVARPDAPKPRGDVPVSEAAGSHTASLVTASGARLAAVTITAMTPPEGQGIILPRGALRPLADLAKGQAEMLIGITANGFSAAVARPDEQVFFRTKLIDGAGDYPDWRRIVPAERPLKARLKLAAFRRTLEQVSLIAGDPDAGGSGGRGGKARVTAVKLVFGEAEVAVSSRNQLGEEAAAACPLTWAAGDATGEPSLTINASHLTWAVTSLGEPDEIDLAFAAEVSPVIVTRAGDESRESLRLVMPLRG